MTRGGQPAPGCQQGGPADTQCQQGHPADTQRQQGHPADTEKRAPDPDDLRRVVETALAEDLRYGPDATTAATVPADAVAVAELTARTRGVLAGLPAAHAVLDAVLGPDGYTVLATRADGDLLVPDDVAVAVRAPVRGLLTAERTALNLVCHLS
ncbi:MAG: hypothetical protein JOY78_07980, partial [Pseudonocardia sp.]|nr:hypothetical protein [Pseudonocardia sp.]